MQHSTLAVIAASAAVLLFLCPVSAQTDGPAFCKGLDCPQFTVASSTDEYEVRDYAPSLWVSTTVRSRFYGSASYTCFRRLFEYIQGDNKRNETIAMTAPVIMRLRSSGTGLFQRASYTMSFYIPPSHSDNSPLPNNPDVVFTEMPAQRVYVKHFSGFASGATYASNARRLARELTSANKAYESSFYYTAGYDGPYTFMNRRNEVWFLANDQ
ncbi:heme-binding protein 2-like [Diadema setosum]|uniref:heme-binding protein 2-like n=1 Tax=Diadema setosum TaxID=31175 RepID=UPI003B3AD4C7